MDNPDAAGQPDESAHQRSKGSGRGLIVPTKTTVLRETTLPSGHLLQVRHGDITKEDSAAIVNPSNELLNLTQGIAGNISRAAGRKVKKECDEFVQAKGKLGVSHTAVTGNGNLPLWREDDPQFVEQYSAAVRNAVAAAHARGLDSLAMPALSTLATYPKQVCAALTFQAALQFWRDTPHSMLKQIRFTSSDLETVSAFKDEFERRAADAFSTATQLPKTEREIAALFPKKTNSDDAADLFESFSK